MINFKSIKNYYVFCVKDSNLGKIYDFIRNFKLIKNYYTFSLNESNITLKCNEKEKNFKLNEISFVGFKRSRNFLMNIIIFFSIVLIYFLTLFSFNSISFFNYEFIVIMLLSFLFSISYKKYFYKILIRDIDLNTFEINIRKYHKNEAIYFVKAVNSKIKYL